VCLGKGGGLKRRILSLLFWYRRNGSLISEGTVFLLVDKICSNYRLRIQKSKDFIWCLDLMLPIGDGETSLRQQLRSRGTSSVQ
jgi:hypothetical protein